MADVTFNGSIVIENNASGDADFPATLPVKQADGSYIDTEVDSIIVTDVVIFDGKEPVTIASVA